MSTRSKTRRGKESGFTLLMVTFTVAVMLITAAAVAPNLLTQGRREKEEEMIWRGQQYARAIGLYYKKFGKYPTKVEDLTRPTNGVRFLRQAYKDPINKDDGSWRFIYVGPNGQLIGSLRHTSLLQNTLSIPGLGAAASLGGLQSPAAPSAANANQAPGQVVGQGISQGMGQTGQQLTNGLSQNPLESQPQGLTGNVLGGNIIGVGGKIKKSSQKIYLGGETYQEWEFIWNPGGQTSLPGQQPANPNVNPTTAPVGANPNNPDGQQLQQQPGTQTPLINIPPTPSPNQ
jgi:type II secretory pathway pseudopilin PulG